MCESKPGVGSGLESAFEFGSESTFISDSESALMSGSESTIDSGSAVFPEATGRLGLEGGESMPESRKRAARARGSG